MPQSQKHYQPIFVARQPIFDASESVWGYELLFRHSDLVATALVPDQDVATASVIADGFSMAREGVDPGRKIFINFPFNLILQETTLALPKDVCIIEILESVQPTPQILAALKRIKENGYILALDDFVGQPGFEPFLELADIVKVDVFGQSPLNIIKFSQQLKKYGCQLLAEKVETSQVYQLTKSLGFSYFQGFFFSKPEMVQGRKIPTEKMARMRLLQEMAREEYEVRNLARIISTDISLSYRLLKYLNSAYLAFSRKIESITQAITMVGGQFLKQWLMVVILSDIDNGDLAQELIFTSMSRGRFLELMAQSLEKKSPYSPETMFLLGLFSKLDVLLGQSMQEIMASMPLHQEIKAAFFGERNRAAAWLDLAVSIDAGNWPHIQEMLSGFGIAPEKAAIHHNDARTWAYHLLDQSRETGK